MRQPDRLSWPELLTWTGLGMGTGLVAGFALSEWVGGLTAPRVRRRVERLRHPERRRPRLIATARAVAAALAADPRLAGVTLEALPDGRGGVELRGWVPTRAARTVALRVARAVPGVEGVVNRILVRGEDDRVAPDAPEGPDPGP